MYKLTQHIFGHTYFAVLMGHGVAFALFLLTA